MISQIQTILWASQPILEIMVAVMMIRRKLHRTFPVFFSYLVAQVLMFCILYPVEKVGSHRAYFYCYWVSCGISLVLGFKVIYEIFLDVFRPYHALKDLGAMLFKWAALVLLLAAVVIAIASPSQDRGTIIEAILVTQRSVRVIHCGLVALLLIFARHLGISWKQNSFGIALGFGFYSVVELVVFALYNSGLESGTMVDALTVLAYCLSVSIWLIYSCFKNAPRQASESLLTSQRWNQSLADIDRPVGDDSLIPMFEGMVDRAFSKVPGESYLLAEPVGTRLASSVRFTPDMGAGIYQSGISPVLSTKF